ncbi:MAG: tryptophan--tRNA ligase [Methanomicrobiales archaeon]|nr:tryptophan--tRNA ligase [Methanomicrobiales archaeon]
MNTEENGGRINPWGTAQSLDYERLFAEFGIEPIETVVDELPEIPPFIRRGIVIGHRDYQQIAAAMRQGTPFHVLTGFMPSGLPHLGHLMVMKEVVWHVEHGGNGYISIADREAHAVRGISWEDCDRYGREYLKVLFALGFKGKTYFQSRNETVKDLAFESSIRVNLSELQAIYGFGPETSLSHPMSVITQVADILYPQVDSYPAPTLVPVGVDQDPHLRLTRDIAHKFRMFTVEVRENYVSVRSKNAPPAALERIHNLFPGSRLFEGHVDIFGETAERVSTVAREVEREHGGYGFYSPSSTYHIFMPGLQGGKMSSSIPESLFGFYEEDASVRKKIMNAFTGGRSTLEEQKRLGGEPETCPVFLLNLFHLAEEDVDLEEIRRRCREGALMCGACKKETLSRVMEFLADFRDRMDEVAHLAED